MELLELFDKVVAKRQAITHVIGSNEDALEQPDIASSGAAELRINIKPLESHYPHIPPTEVLTWMIEFVRQAPEDKQVQPTKRQDFELAKRIFAGNGARVIVGDQVEYLK
jgi:hypothetical protein